MTTKYIAGGLAAIAVLALVYVFLFQSGGTETAVGERSSAPTPQTGSTDAPEEGSVAAGTYEIYAPEKLALAEKGKVVLYFHADWCPICRSLEKDIQEAGVPAGVNILKVDYDSSQALKQKYGVTYQHTFVQVDAQGSQVAKWGDAFTLSDLLRRVK